MIHENILNRYLEQQLSPQDNLLDALEKETFLKTINPRKKTSRIPVIYLPDDKT